YLALVTILSVATYFDLRYLKIPKPLSLICLALGLAANLVRAGWIGAEQDSLLGGLLDGFLFSLYGFALGFGIFVGMWFLGLCGGGDVKIFAAVGAWIGFSFTFWLWVGSLTTLIVLAGVRYMLHVVARGASSARQAYSANANKEKGKDSP